MENTLHAIFGKRLPILFPCLCSICTCYSLYVNVFACTCLHPHLHSNLSVWVYMHRDDFEVHSRGGQKAHTCRRSAESITIIWRSENRETEEMKQRTEGSHSAPRHCYFKLFSSYWGRREQFTAHTLIEATQSALSANRRKRKIKEQRGQQKEGRVKRFRR